MPRWRCDKFGLRLGWQITLNYPTFTQLSIQKSWSRPRTWNAHVQVSAYMQLWLEYNCPQRTCALVQNAITIQIFLNCLVKIVIKEGVNGLHTVFLFSIFLYCMARHILLNMPKKEQFHISEFCSLTSLDAAAVAAAAWCMNEEKTKGSRHLLKYSLLPRRQEEEIVSSEFGN
jgi:hypothetical protein